MKKNRNDSIITDEERKTQDMSAVADYDGEKSNRAKLVEHEGDDYVDTPAHDDSLAGKAGNFWYHRKWQVLFAVFFVVIAVVGILQVVRRESNKTDLSVLYAGPKTLTAEETDLIAKTFGELLTADINGDGKTAVKLYTITYLNERQQAEYRERGGEIDLSQNRKNYADYSDLVFTGECGVMMLDAELYENLKKSGGLEPLESALGYVPGKTADGYGVRLCDTALYEKYEALRALPGETVLCLRSLSTAGGVMISEAEARQNYKSGARMLKDLFSVAGTEN